MAKEGLSAKEVAKILKRSPKTVFAWRSDRNVPDWVLPLLSYELTKQQR